MTYIYLQAWHKSLGSGAEDQAAAAAPPKGKAWPGKGQRGQQQPDQATARPEFGSDIEFRSPWLDQPDEAQLDELADHAGALAARQATRVCCPSLAA